MATTSQCPLFRRWAGLALRSLMVLCILLTLAPSAQAQSEIDNWLRWEQTLLTTRDYHLNNGNPYRNLILRVTYTPVAPIACTGLPWCQSFTGYGFWDGSRTFKIRSAFPEGTWRWQVTCTGSSNGFDCATDPALNASGTVTVYAATIGTDLTDPYKDGLPWRGFVRISDDQRYLVHGDGVSRFFWQADTAWGPALNDVNSNTRWDAFLTDRYNRRFTAVLMAVAPSEDSAANAAVLFEDVGGSCTGATWPKSCSRWKPDYFQKLDEKIRRANAKGMLVVLAGIMDPLSNFSNNSPVYPNPQDAAIFARNLAARLSGSHVIFSPSFDDRLSAVSSSGLMDWVGCALREAAPRHLVTAHLAGASTTADYQTMHNRRWHQLHVFQSGHAKNTSGINSWEDPYEFAVRRARTMPLTLYNTTTSGAAPACPNTPAISLPAPAAVKPNVNGEGAYDWTYVQATYTQLNSQAVDTPQGVRHTGYSSTLNGAAGFTLGVLGIFNWNNITTTTLNAQGSQQMKILADQFKLLPWESLQWRSSLVKNQRTESTASGPKPEEDKQVVLATTSDNNVVLMYAPDNDDVKVDLSLFTGFDCNTTTWTKTWVNPRTGSSPLPQEPQPQCVNLVGDPSGATHNLKRPGCVNEFQGDGGNCDWIIKLKRTGKTSSAFALSGLEVWSEPTDDGSNWRVRGRLSRPDAGVRNQAFTISDPRDGGRILKQPVIAQDAQGDFVVAWEDGFDGDFHGIFMRRVDGQGRLLDREYPVNRTVKHDQTNPWAAIGSNGGVVTWTSYAQDGDFGGIFARRINPAGVPFGPEIPINFHTAGHQDFSRVGIDLQGNFVVAWTSAEQDGDAEGVYARRFNARGEPLEDEFRVNTTSVGAQFLTDLDMDPLEGFLVTWTAYAPDGSSLGVFGQRYDPSGLAVGGEFLVASSSNSESAN